jgi:hypothetical protein
LADVGGLPDTLPDGEDGVAVLEGEVDAEAEAELDGVGSGTLEYCGSEAETTRVDKVAEAACWKEYVSLMNRPGTTS